MYLLVDMINNSAMWIAIFAWALAQLIKILLDLKKTGRIKISLLLSSGGMPSSHSALVAALTTSVGYIDGCSSNVFAVSAIMSMVVMYDAAGVRRAAGTQARAINMLVASLEDRGVVLDKKLKELLGHSPFEVGAGAILGIAVALFFCNLLGL